MYPGNVAGGISNISDLDKITDYRLPIDISNRLRFYMKPIGVEPGFVTTYRSACVHGWAPTPTNDYQKAVWEEVRSEKERGPAKGLKIEPRR